MSEDGSVNAGSIAVEVVATTSKLEAGMKGASRTIDQFSQSASTSLDKYTQALTKVEFGGRQAKKALKEIGHTLGSAGGAGASVATAMLTMGPAVGLAMGALHLYNDAMAKSEENVKSLEKATQSYAETQKNIDIMMGKRNGPVGHFSKDVESEMEKTQKTIDEQRAQLKSTLSSPGAMMAHVFFGSTDIKDLQESIDTGLDYQRTLAKIAVTTDEASEAQKKFDATITNIDMTTKTGSDEQLLAKRIATNELMKALSASLEKLPETGAKFKEVQDEWNKNFIKAKMYQEEVDKKISDAAEKHRKEQQDAQDAMFKMKGEEMMAFHAAEEKKMEEAQKTQEAIYKKQGELSKRIVDEMKTPFDNLKDKVDEIMGSALNDDIKSNALEHLKSEFDKNNAPKLSNVGSEAFSKSLVDLASLADSSGNREQKVEDALVAGKLDILITETRQKNKLPAPEPRAQ